MKKPSRVIFMALCKTYGVKKRLFMCNAIQSLHTKGLINKSEQVQACEAVMEFVYSYDPYAKTLFTALQKRGLMAWRTPDKVRIKVARRLYIKLIVKLFFKGL